MKKHYGDAKFASVAMDHIRRFAASYKTFVLLTDLEPDDVAAIRLFLAAGIKFTTIVVGEGADVRRKTRWFVENFPGVHPATVLHGMGSGKDYPRVHVKSLRDAQQDVLRVGTDTIPPESLVICLKPPREFMMYVKENKWSAERLFASSDMLYSGGHNTRCLLRDYSAENVTRMLAMFRTLFLYESFFVDTRVNSVSPDNSTPETIAELRAHSATAEIMTVWDEMIARGCDGISQKQPQEHVGHRMALVDIGLALTSPADYTEEAISIDEKKGLTKKLGGQFEGKHALRVRLVKPLGAKEIISRLQEALAGF